jgi:hypothetical protein
MIAYLIMPASLDDQLAIRFHHGLAFLASCALAMLASASIWLTRFLASESCHRADAILVRP